MWFASASFNLKSEIVNLKRFPSPLFFASFADFLSVLCG
jgi:hypothetical protein